LWANIYLNELDQFIKRTLGARRYLRYMDDFLLFSDNKEELWDWKDSVRNFLYSLRLSMHERSSTVYPVAAGVPFLGFRVYPTHIRLKRRNGVAFSKRFRKQRNTYAKGLLSRAALDARVQGWIAHAAHGNTWNLRKSLFSQPLPNQNKSPDRHETVPNFLSYL